MSPSWIISCTYFFYFTYVCIFLAINSYIHFWVLALFSVVGDEDYRQNGAQPTIIEHLWR